MNANAVLTPDPQTAKMIDFFAHIIAQAALRKYQLKQKTQSGSIGAQVGPATQQRPGPGQT